MFIWWFFKWTRWWQFQICFIFTPNLGEMIQFPSYFSDGLVQNHHLVKHDASPPRGKLPRYSGWCEITQQREAHLCGAGGGLSKVVTCCERVLPMVKSWEWHIWSRKNFWKNPLWTILCWNTFGHQNWRLVQDDSPKFLKISLWFSFAHIYKH